MAQAGLRAVGLICIFHLDIVVLRTTVCEAVGHEHIEYVGVGESLSFLALHLAGLQQILHLLLLLAHGEVEFHLSRLCAVEIQVH